MFDTYVTEVRTSGFRGWHYQVWVDGQIFDTFDSTVPLTWSAQWDVAGLYAEALSAREFGDVFAG